MSGGVVKAIAISKCYRRADRVVQALCEVSFQVKAGERVVLTGPSGSGKTTLLNIIAALDHADSGSITVSGKDITRLSTWAGARFRSRQVGIIFQAYNLLPQLTAFENVLLPMIALGQPDKGRVHELLQAVGLGDRSSHRPTELSGGEQQRVAIARALANNPPLLLADEPTGNLDKENARLVMDLLTRACRERSTTLIVATHDPGTVRLANRILALRSGSL